MNRVIFIIGLVSSLVAGSIFANEAEERYRQAGHPATTAAMFTELALDKDAAIRKRVASNRKTPNEILLRLARDPEPATNLSAADDVYFILAFDSVQSVRSVVARFEYVPVKALEILARDKDVDIRMEVARNLNSTHSILTQLMNDSDNTIKTIAGQALQRLKEDK